MLNPNGQTITPRTNWTQGIAEQIFARSAGAQLTLNNQVKCLFNSSENFPAWEEAISSAQESILIEMYIFASNDFGKRIRDILIEKAQQGIQVYLIYDWLGSLKQHYTRFFSPLIHAGAVVVAYNRPALNNGFGLFARDHRKLIIVDRSVAFIGGLCISSLWEGDEAKGIPQWRDTGIRLKGGIVNDAISAFAETLYTEKISLPANLSSANQNQMINGNVAARLIATTPASANMMRLDLLIISLARQTLWITDAYFMATGMYLNLLKSAAADGVDVRLLVPKTSDIRWIGTVSRTQYRPLLEAGIRVFEWNGAMIHAKSAVVDSRWVRVGSTNLNISSWLANREIDVAIEDKAIANELQDQFLRDLENATEVILANQKTTLKHPRAKASNPPRAKAKAATRQAFRFGEVLDATVRGTRMVSENEAFSFVSLGIFFFILATTFFFFPNLIAIPLSLLFCLSGIALVAKAIGLKRSSKVAKAKADLTKD